jgi:tRNA uridine 5-carboxymethylaminomethyl modification enzyme
MALKDRANTYIRNNKIKSEIVNEYLEEIGESAVKDSTDYYSLTKRSTVQLDKLLRLTDEHPDEILGFIQDKKLLTQLQTEVKYEGYIQRQLKELNYFLDNEDKKIPTSINYNEITSLSKEAREKLSKIKPTSLGQASRISGVSASDVSILAIYLK